MLTTARGQSRTFYFPPANCVISCCHWRAQGTVGEENGPVLAQERVRPYFICLKLCDGFRLAPLRSFVEIPNSGFWRCLSMVPFLSSLFFFFFPPSAISCCSWHCSSACHCLFCCPRKVMDESRRLCDYRTGKIAKALKRSVINVSF